eukprot:135009_1
MVMFLHRFSALWLLMMFSGDCSEIPETGSSTEQFGVTEEAILNAHRLAHGFIKSKVTNMHNMDIPDDIMNLVAKFSQLEHVNQTALPNDDLYEGQFLIDEWDNIMPHGKGLLTRADTYTYHVGRPTLRQPGLVGEFRPVSGFVYKGDLRYGKKHGFGTQTWANKQKNFKGKFENGLKNGPGTETYFDSHNTVTDTITATWRDGQIYGPTQKTSTVNYNILHEK